MKLLFLGLVGGSDGEEVVLEVRGLEEDGPIISEHHLEHLLLTRIE